MLQIIIHNDAGKELDNRVFDLFPNKNNTFDTFPTIPSELREMIASYRHNFSTINIHLQASNSELTSIMGNFKHLIYCYGRNGRPMSWFGEAAKHIFFNLENVAENIVQ